VRNLREPTATTRRRKVAAQEKAGGLLEIIEIANLRLQDIIDTLISAA
jgi:2-oxo-4-hydroxy-4-carboxy--5-ureidoimidazoline (OHCU) decarboxylase